MTELIKKRSKVHKKNMTIERALSFDQSQKFLQKQ